jgi:multidrug efflux system outer membrane protein
MRAPLIALLSAVLLAGCSTAPPYARPDLPVPSTLGAGAAPAAAPGVQPADLAWRDFFTDERLRRVITLALENNRDLRIAVANVAQARALYKVQRADLLPSVGVSGSATYERTPAAVAGSPAAAGANGHVRTDLNEANLGLSAWEIDLFGRVRNLTQSAQQSYFASAANRDAARTALIAEVAAAWLTLAADQDQLRIARDTAQTFSETLQITEGRAQEGVASDLEVRQARTSYDQARSDIAAATTAVAQDRNALRLLVGAETPQELLPGALGEGDVTLDKLPADLPSTVLLRRPDVAAAEHQLRSANADVGAARAAFFPTISLTAALGTLSPQLSGLFGGGGDYWSVAPSANLPIFDFGRRRGNLRYAEATREAMVANYEKTVQTAFRETADALARRSTIGEQLDAQVSLAENADAAYRLAHARYAEGVDPFLTTLVAQRTRYAAQQSLVATRLTRQINAVELYRALGGGLLQRGDSHRGEALAPQKQGLAKPSGVRDIHVAV